MSGFQIIFSIFTLLYVLWVLSVLFLERRREASMTSWLLIFILLPFVGFAVYAIFGRDMSKKKVFRLYQAEEELRRELSAANLAAYGEKRQAIRQNLRDRTEVLDFTFRLSPAGLTFDNQVQVFTDGALKFRAFMEDLRQARREIHILTFIYQGDGLGGELRQLLVEKAREGVKVRLLLDHFGSFGVSHGYFKELEEAGGRVYFSFPIRPGNLQLNNRNHRKIAIIDGHTAFIGGFNVGDEYLGLSRKRGYWRDTHLRIRGSSVIDLQTRFILDWRNAGGEDLVLDGRFFPEAESQGQAAVQILSSGPDSQLEEIKLTYLEMISRARDYIYFQTPYFVPDEAMLEALRIALIKGVDVRLMIPDKKDHAFVYWATYSYIGDLLPLGLKAYAYENGFLHAKTMVVDGKISSVGSANFDKRSFRLSFETNAFIFDNRFGKMMKDIFLEDLKQSREITEASYRARPLHVRIREPISRLISPVL